MTVYTFSALFAPNFNLSTNYAGLSIEAAHNFARKLRENPRGVFGLPTGGTPMGFYLELICLHYESGLDFSKAEFFNLDEQIGLPPLHPQSYESFMQKNFFGHINARKNYCHIPNGNARDLEEECYRYEKLIKDVGGINLLVAGIGGNGHLGFNEPGTPFDKPTHVVELSYETRRDNARFFGGNIDLVPTRAITMGLGTILQAGEIMVLANGLVKAPPIARSWKEPPNVQCPASSLQHHDNVTFYLDYAAYSGRTLQIYSGNNGRSR